MSSKHVTFYCHLAATDGMCNWNILFKCHLKGVFAHSSFENIVYLRGSGPCFSSFLSHFCLQIIAILINEYMNQWENGMLILFAIACIGLIQKLQCKVKTLWVHWTWSLLCLLIIDLSESHMSLLVWIMSNGIHHAAIIPLGIISDQKFTHCLCILFVCFMKEICTI